MSFSLSQRKSGIAAAGMRPGFQNDDFLLTTDFSLFARRGGRGVGRTRFPATAAARLTRMCQCRSSPGRRRGHGSPGDGPSPSWAVGRTVWAMAHTVVVAGDVRATGPGQGPSPYTGESASGDSFRLVSRFRAVLASRTRRLMWFVEASQVSEGISVILPLWSIFPAWQRQTGQTGQFTSSSRPVHDQTSFSPHRCQPWSRGTSSRRFGIFGTFNVSLWNVLKRTF